MLITASLLSRILTRRNRIHEVVLRLDCRRCDSIGYRLGYGVCIAFQRQSNGADSAGNPRSRPFAHARTYSGAPADSGAATRAHAGTDARSHS